MRVILNGEQKEITDSLSLQQFIQLFSKNNQALIVELNGKIIQNEKRKDCKLKAGDRLELIQLVGGG